MGCAVGSYPPPHYTPPYHTHTHMFSRIRRLLEQATNSSALQSHKLFAMDVRSHFFCRVPQTGGDDADECAAEADVGQSGCMCQESRVIVPDLCYVPSPCTGNTMHALWVMQLQRCGLRCRFVAPHTDQTFSCGVPHIQIWCFNTDSGGDQTASMAAMNKKCRSDLYCWYFWWPCFLHQIHLIVKKQLAQSPDYFSRMAKLVNVWRSSTIASKLFVVWKQRFGHARAQEAAGRVPPRPLRGRWGSMTACEQHFIRCGMKELAAAALASVCFKLRVTRLFIVQGCGFRPADTEDAPGRLKLSVASRMLKVPDL